MTQPATIPASTSPTGRQWWTRSRGLLLALFVLIAAAAALAAARSGEEHGRLDPRSADRHGSRALAALLADRGVRTTIATGTREAIATAGPDVTLLVTDPDLLTEQQQVALHDAVTGSGTRTVLIAPGPASLGVLAPGVRTAPAAEVTNRRPHCALAAAVRAGDARLGGVRYTTSDLRAGACYPHAGTPTLLRLRGRDDGDTVLIGAPDIFFNDRLDERGNASLALQLLGSRSHLVWYLPSLSDTAATDGGDRSFFELIPSGWHWALLQLAVAAVLAAVWRARRLGPLVTERLPVSVRASESTEGRARLYRQADARDRAADALRTATRSRLAPLVGVPALQAHRTETLSPAVSAHLAARTGSAVDSLLFGPAPTDDASLIRLADELDTLERTVKSNASSASAPPSDKEDSAP